MVGFVDFYHEDLDINDPHNRMIASYRLLAKVPTIAAMAYKYSVGQPFMYPRNDLNYAENFLQMMFGVPCEPYRVNPVLARALNRIFILHADHEQNASTSTASTPGRFERRQPVRSDLGGDRLAVEAPRTAVANEAVVSMLTEIGSVERIPDFVARAKDRNGPVPADGLRPPGLQELRSARRRAARRALTKCWPSSARRMIRCCQSPWSLRRLRLRKSTSSASCSPTSTSIRASS